MLDEVKLLGFLVLLGLDARGKELGAQVLDGQGSGSGWTLTLLPLVSRLFEIILLYQA